MPEKNTKKINNIRKSKSSTSKTKNEKDAVSVSVGATYYFMIPLIVVFIIWLISKQ